MIDKSRIKAVAWAEIDLDAFKRNLESIRKVLNNGDSAIEKYKLCFSLDGDYKEFDVVPKGDLMLASKADYNVKRKSNELEFINNNDTLVPNDVVLTDELYIKPDPYTAQFAAGRSSRAAESRRETAPNGGAFLRSMRCRIAWHPPFTRCLLHYRRSCRKTPDVVYLKYLFT